MDDDLARLLASGERAAFHGAPGGGVDALRRAVELAGAADQAPQASAAAWLLGVCLGASGRYGDALGVLSLLADGGGTAQEVVFTSLARSTSASLHRQLGRHAAARALDAAALDCATEDESRFDALLGLGADAVGLERADEARDHLAQASALVDAHQDWWRQRVRSSWVETEVALLTEQADVAVEASTKAVTVAEASGAPRHVAKSSLFLGVSLVEAGRLSEGAGRLRRAALLAESLGALPLVWPSRAVLGALLAESAPQESARALDAARATIETIAGNLSEQMRAEWFVRPDVAGLLERT